MNFNLKELIKGILIICSYFILQIIFTIPFIFLLIKEKITENTIQFLVFLACAITYSIIYRKTISKDFKDFKNNYKNILKTNIKYYIIGFFIMIISSNIIKLLGIQTTANQISNISSIKENPFLYSIIVIMFAPMIEELIFRKSFQNLTKNKWLFAIITGIIFASVHIISSLTSLKDLPMLLHIIPYSSLGIALGYAYKKHNNIVGTMLIHAFHNSLAVLEILFLL